jgi:hypothetical protein
VRIVELAIAGLFAMGGLRSLWVWSHRPFEGGDLTDHLLYSLYLTGRIGLWFAFSGLFLLYAVEEGGHATSGEPGRFRWYFLVLIALAVLQLLAGFALGRRSPD